MADTCGVGVSRVLGSIVIAVTAVVVSGCAVPSAPSSSLELAVAFAEELCGQGNYRVAEPLLYQPSGADWWYSIQGECVTDPGRSPQQVSEIAQTVLGSGIDSVEEPEDPGDSWRYRAKPSEDDSWDDLQVFPNASSFSLRVFI